MKRFLLFLTVGIPLLLLTSSTASAFGWNDVIAMHEAGIADSLILQKIEYSGATFRLNAKEMKALKEAGVSDEVVSAMLRTEAAEDDEYGDGYGSDEDYGYYRHPYVYPHRRVYGEFGLGVYGPYPWEYDPYWYPRYGRYGRYGRVYYEYPSYRYHERRHRPYGGYYRYDRYGRPGPEPIRYRTRVESRIDTHNRGFTGYRSRPGTGTPRMGLPRTGGPGPSPTRIRRR